MKLMEFAVFEQQLKYINMVFAALYVYGLARYALFS